VGLVLDVVGTLFISLDALRGQGQATKIYDILAFITGFEIIETKHHSGDEKARKLSARALEAVPADASQDVRDLAAKLKALSDAADMVAEVEPIAAGRNKEILKDKLDSVSAEFAARKNLISAAIATVFIGGVCEFVAGVILL
jgi:hypothetical protein